MRFSHSFSFSTFEVVSKDVLHDWLDLELALSEDCLHLAVYTPWKPDGSSNKSLPVMFFIHGGTIEMSNRIRDFMS